jgi:hypothetical protein
MLLYHDLFVPRKECWQDGQRTSNSSAPKESMRSLNAFTKGFQNKGGFTICCKISLKSVISPLLPLLVRLINDRELGLFLVERPLRKSSVGLLTPQQPRSNSLFPQYLFSASSDDDELPSSERDVARQLGMWSRNAEQRDGSHQDTGVFDMLNLLRCRLYITREDIIAHVRSASKDVMVALTGWF